MPLNANAVFSLAAQPGRDRTVYFDRGKGGVAGLCVRVTLAGHRSYWFRYQTGGLLGAEVAPLRVHDALATDDHHVFLKLVELPPHASLSPAKSSGCSGTSRMSGWP